MKANAPKRKVFQDALDLLAEDPVKDMPVPVNGIVSIPVEEIHPFHDHPFRLYEGERLEDMVQSIREHGVLNPVIVRKAARGYEMLAGHNRTNAAKIAGLTEVPAIVKTYLSDEDAYVYVIETNLLQRSFAELLPSEKAAVLVARYEKISSQGKRNDIRLTFPMLSDKFFHPDHVIPAVELITALMESSNHRITQFFMKQHAVLRQIFIFRLWISNAGIDI